MSRMDNLLLFTLLISGLCCVSSSMPRRYHFVNQRKMWKEAQKHCRDRYTDLATIENMDEMKAMMSTVKDGYNDKVWIGLWKTGDYIWRWSLQDSRAYSVEQTNFTSWEIGEPNNAFGPEDCVAFEGGYWSDIPCEKPEYPYFICYDEGQSQNESYKLVRQRKMWRYAKEYCVTKHTDLASVRSQTENQIINQTAAGERVWIGLYRDYWRWSDQSDSLFRFWYPPVPDNYEGKDGCAVTWLNEKGRWGDRNCVETNPFFCYESKLVLVRQNKTWKEAADYCERHHMGLVLAYSEEIQGWTREVAMGASTAHVWLGMFFVCPLNLWFWTNRVTVCLSDWAMGNGTRRDECGQAGALQSGGQQKWVSQPETERLNFICSAF